MPLKIPKDNNKEILEGPQTLTDPNEISVDAAVVAVLSDLHGILTLKEKQ